MATGSGKAAPDGLGIAQLFDEIAHGHEWPVVSAVSRRLPIFEARSGHCAIDSQQGQVMPTFLTGDGLCSAWTTLVDAKPHAP